MPFDLFCFGTLAQRNSVSEKALDEIIEKIKAKYIFCDVNLRQNYYSKVIIEKSLKYSTRNVFQRKDTV